MLRKLISYDIDNMGCSLLKSVNNGKTESKDFLKVKQSLTLIGSKIVDNWESGTVNPRLRVGFALASLICFRPSINEDKHIESSRFYKLLVNAIQDVTLTDHWIIRIRCVSE